MSNLDYRPRLAEKILERKLNSSGCVLVTGPKFCGKSTLCGRYAQSITALKDAISIDLADADPRSALIGKSPHLIDEWQKVPEIWNCVKNDLDEKYEFGKFILTGSTTPVDPSKIQHSGAGRISSMVLKPFTLYESGESNGSISLEKLFQGAYEVFPTCYSNPITLADVAFWTCRGGWPISLMAKKEYAIETTRNYFDGLFAIENESDEFSLFLKNKNIDLLQLTLKCYARNISTQAKQTTMRADILASGLRDTLDDETFSEYAKTLKNLFLIYDMPAWNINLRSSVAVRAAPTHHFIDTSMATCALGLSPQDLLMDLHSFGYFFEDFAIRDLSVYCQALNGTLRHYRDSSGQEVDAILELPNGAFAAIEIKIASEKNVKEGIRSLQSFEAKLMRSGHSLPKFKMLLTSHGPSYKTPEGIFIIPLNFLKD